MGIWDMLRKHHDCVASHCFRRLLHLAVQIHRQIPNSFASGEVFTSFENTKTQWIRLEWNIWKPKNAWFTGSPWKAPKSQGSWTILAPIPGASHWKIGRVSSSAWDDTKFGSWRKKPQEGPYHCVMCLRTYLHLLCWIDLRFHLDGLSSGQYDILVFFGPHIP